MLPLIFILLFSPTYSSAKNDVYFYFDDGGEHDYFKKCEKVSSSRWSEVKNKLENANKKTEYLGKTFEEGELTNTTEHYFSSESKCNLELKKDSAWFYKEKKK